MVIIVVLERDYNDESDDFVNQQIQRLVELWTWSIRIIDKEYLEDGDDDKSLIKNMKNPNNNYCCFAPTQIEIKQIN
ncbi:hypothetical protein Glove_19g323 [Diversispora epigaea]|uniref:Uncharacterized protein n=1 Tax=Diversispora epigaea TaxID=1348612 RepID=A0A397JL11_9GLOM|nr:hypothetical protein Glove_19g323 [Diversispora epigaea]